MPTSIQNIQENIADLKHQIVNHKVYSIIEDLIDLRIFMQYHVYAVWDFMSLLKALQINLTCTSTPWFVVGSGNTRALINEIIAGEEADLDYHGDKKSHFEMYLDAMNQCGAETTEIKNFLTTLKNTGSFKNAYEFANTPIAAQEFVNYTFELINSKKTHLQASAFTFGREDLIPAMFLTMVSDLNKKFPEQLSLFKYYLDRHIEVDGEHHSKLALQMIEELCNNNETLIKEAELITKEALLQRIALWDGAYEAILEKKSSFQEDSTVIY